MGFSAEIYDGTKERSPLGFRGIDKELALLLKEIIDQTDAEVILTSTWKTDYLEGSKDGRYLEKELGRCDITIKDCTFEDRWFKRAEGISNYLNAHPAESFVILDDEIFTYKKDYPENWELGLSKETAAQAISILNKGEN